MPIGVIGADESGRAVRNILRQAGIATDGLIVEKSYPTPLKTRILAGEENTKKQQILRIDREGRVPDSARPETEAPAGSPQSGQRLRCPAHLRLPLRYGQRGPLHGRRCPSFKKAGLPVTLDSRFRLLRFAGVTIATPNEPEVEEALKMRLDDDPKRLNDAGRSSSRQAPNRPPS